MHTLVVGGGSWGTTAAHLLAHNSPVTLWVRDKSSAVELQQTRENSRYLPGSSIHANVAVTSDMDEACSGVNLVVFAVPTTAMRSVSQDLSQQGVGAVTAISLAKGFEPGTNLRMTQVISEELPESVVGVMTGPNLCKEILIGKPASGVVAFEQHRPAVQTQRLFTTSTFRVFTGSDVIGCELGGALKNVYVIAAAIVEGMGLGDNARAAVITRGLSELCSLGEVMGADQRTLVGLAGLGDLVASCMSPQSRNATVGRQLGMGKSLDEIVESLGQVAEGVTAAKSAYELARAHGVAMPIADLVFEICWRGASAQDAAARLLAGRLGAE